MEILLNGKCKPVIASFRQSYLQQERLFNSPRPGHGGMYEICPLLKIKKFCFCIENVDEGVIC